MNIIEKIKKKLNNRGSSIIMVIVSVAFVAIIVGALLSAAGYAYRLKLVNKNAKDNFYYVEQAMQEVYAGVGSKTVEQMYDAYTSTIENMVYYDLGKDAYTTLTNEQANAMFKRRFMENIQNEEYFRKADADLAASLQNFITNDTVKIDTAALHVEQEETTENGTTYISKIIIKDVTLTRTSEYKNNAGSGTYTQTISADIEIGQPDFEVDFNNTSANYSNIFDYAMVSDMGIEISQPKSVTLKITGNIYAAADYYNKSYNKAQADTDSFVNESGKSETSKDRYFKYTYKQKDAENVEKDVTISYTHQAISSKSYTDKDTVLPEGTKGLYNAFAKDSTNKPLYFDGVNPNSMYSGLYIEGSNVSIMADRVIVPGTIAVMNDADLSIYKKENASLSQTEIWTDNIVLGGYGEKVAEDATPAANSTYKSPNAYLCANLYVRDDTELNAERSSLIIKGAYLGYGNSTEKDTRVFVPTVDTENFQTRVARLDEDGNEIKEEGKTVYDYLNRDHYNSSAIVINGQNSTLDLSKTSVLYLAGRAYIELSKDVTYNSEDGHLEEANTTQDQKVYVDANGKLTDTATNNTEVVTETYQFTPGEKYKDANGANYLDSDGKAYETYISDYKTGESIALKSSQVAYIPIILNGLPAPYTIGSTVYTCVQLSPDIKGVDFFADFFPTSIFTDGYVPVISQTMSNRTYYYYDLESAYKIIQSASKDASGVAKTKANDIIGEYKSADEYSAGFIAAYTENAALTDEQAATQNKIKLPLNDIIANEDFTAGNIVVNGTTGASSNAVIYSSGAITTKSDTAFNMVLKNTSDDADALLASQSFTPSATSDSTILKVLEFSKNLSTEYLYMKWNLNSFDASEAAEQDYIDKMLENGWTEDMITPINRYLDFSKITDETFAPSNFSLVSGYKVWISEKDVYVGSDEEHDFVKAGDGTNTTEVKGIIITKGDVIFSDKVTKFEGLIVSAGKVYIKGNALQTMTASPEICRNIMRECIVEVGRKQGERTSLYDGAKLLLSLFREYSFYVEKAESGKCPVCGAVLDVKKETDGEGKETTTITCPTSECQYNDDLNNNELLVDVENLDYTDVCSIDNWKKTVE